MHVGLETRKVGFIDVSAGKTAAGGPCGPLGRERFLEFRDHRFGERAKGRQFSAIDRNDRRIAVLGVQVDYVFPADGRRIFPASSSNGRTPEYVATMSDGSSDRSK